MLRNNTIPDYKTKVKIKKFYITLKEPNNDWMECQMKLDNCWFRGQKVYQ